MGIIEAHLINEYDEVPARAVRIKHVKGSLETPAYAINAVEIDRRLIKEEDLRGIVEVCIPFRPEQLKSMSKDLALQQRFEYRINSYMRKIPHDQLVVAIPLVEGKQKYELSIDEASFYGTYIAELISNPEVDIVCTPIFHRIAEKHVDVLVEKFLEAMTSYNVGVALSIPYTSRETREKLIKIYLDMVDKNNRALLNFLCVDYNSSNPISKYAFHNYVLRYVRELQEEIDEPVVVYGANVKYSRIAKKYDELPARDLASYFAQLDMFGGNHKRKPIPGEVAEKLKAEESIRKQKLLNRDRYIYISLDKVVEEPKLAGPETDLIKKLVDEGRHRSYIEKVVKRINMRNILSEIDILRPLFSGRGWQHFEEPMQYLNSKEIVRIDHVLLKRLKDFAKVLRAGARRLDEYVR